MGVSCDTAPASQALAPFCPAAHQAVQKTGHGVFRVAEYRGDATAVESPGLRARGHAVVPRPGGERTASPARQLAPIQTRRGIPACGAAPRTTRPRETTPPPSCATLRRSPPRRSRPTSQCGYRKPESHSCLRLTASQRARPLRQARTERQSPCKFLPRTPVVELAPLRMCSTNPDPASLSFTLIMPESSGALSRRAVE